MKIDSTPVSFTVHDAVSESRRTLVPFGERRDLATVHQPAR